MPHEIHTSGRRSFRGCRRRWNWIFRENWYPIMTAKPLEFGTAYHEALETYYNPATWSMDREVIGSLAKKVFAEKTTAQKLKYLKLKESTILDADVETDYNERVALGLGMLDWYFKVAPDMDKLFTPVKTEIAFKVPIKNPDTGEILFCKCGECYKEAGSPHDLGLWQGLPVFYAGRLDAIVQDHYGDYWAVDWKTAASLSDKDEFLALDDQVGSYPWALREAGIRVRGFIYHEQRKAFPEPPKENTNRRKGCLFSVSKSQATDYQTYLKTIMEFDNQAFLDGYYDEFLAYLIADGIKYVQRSQIYKSDYELDQIGRNIFLEAQDMIDENLRIYPSAGRFSCSFCAFRQPCLGMNAGEDYMYTLTSMFERREHYYVREEASTESKGGE